MNTFLLQKRGPSGGSVGRAGGGSSLESVGSIDIGVLDALNPHGHMDQLPVLVVYSTRDVDLDTIQHFNPDLSALIAASFAADLSHTNKWMDLLILRSDTADASYAGFFDLLKWL